MLLLAVGKGLPTTQVKNPLYLAIDQGGHASRALVFDSQGEVLSKQFCQIDTSTPKPGWVEHDAERLVVATKEAIVGAVAQLDEKKDRIVAAGLATQRASIVCWHAISGRALSKVISWRDVRAADWIKGFEAESESIHQRTGLYPSPHYGAGKLRWCLDHLPAVQTALKQGQLCFGPLASFLTARITGAGDGREEGKVFSDPSNAGRTLLWNIETHDWDPHLLQTFRIPRVALPQSVPTRYPFGHLSLLEKTIPLMIVTGDQAAAFFHNGFPKDDTVTINLGTGAFLQRVQKKSMAHTGRLLSSVVLSEEDKRVTVLEGTVNGAGSALAWFGNTYQTEAWPKEAGQWLETETAPPLFINAVGGLGSPFWIPQMDSRFIGAGSLPARFAAVIESILFLVRANLDEMHPISDAPKRLVLSGGLSTVDALCQRLADLTMLPIVRPAEPEATARGLVFLLAGPHPSRVKYSDRQTFMPKRNGDLSQRYNRWCQAMTEAIQSP